MVNYTYVHDANGNLTSKSDGGTQTRTYTWDDENRLISVAENSTTIATYQYDSSSRLLQRVAGGTTTNYTWDGWDLVKEEKTGTITETTRYAVPQGGVQSFVRNGNRFYLHGDALSSSQLVTDSNGNQAARIIYGAWGEELYASDSVPNGLDARFVGGGQGAFEGPFPGMTAFLETSPEFEIVMNNAQESAEYSDALDTAHLLLAILETENFAKEILCKSPRWEDLRSNLSGFIDRRDNHS